MRVLTFSGLYPNSVRPQHGVFVEHRMRQLLANASVDLRVVAPVPWFPSSSERFGEYGAHARVPRRERRFDIDTLHPRWLAVPKVGMKFAPSALARAGLRAYRKLQSEGFEPDVIDAHYLYPYGVAATRLGSRVHKPVVLTARGSDVNLIPKVSPFARQRVLEATRSAACVISVSDALRRALIELGAPAERLAVIRNGVDRELFNIPDPIPPRGKQTHVLSVGNLVPLKGHDIAIDALRELPDAKLTIAGRGALRDSLEQRAKDAEVHDRVHFAGSVGQDELRNLYAEADVLVLASKMEGLPNVLLESLSCGTPVVATTVGGIPEVVPSEQSGELIEERTGPVLARAIRAVCDRKLPREVVRATVEHFDWSVCATELAKVLEAAAMRGKTTGRWSESSPR